MPKLDKDAAERKAFLKANGLKKEKDILPLLTPSGFSKHWLKIPVYDCQAQVMDAVLPTGSRVAVRTANEVGKTTTIIAGIIGWHMSIFPFGKVVSTAGVFRQVKEQLGPSLKRFSQKFPKLEFNDTSIVDSLNIARWSGFSTNDPGKFEGYHGSEDEPLMIIVDEAKTVKDDIFQAIERCNPQRVLLASSPGYSEGEFWRAFNSRKEFYDTYKITAAQCPHISQESIDQRIAKWGTSHPLVRSMIYAEFMEFVEDAVIPLTMYDKCMASPPEFERGKERHAFCDFAAGGDENVLAVRDGNRVRLVKCWREKNPMAAVGEFITLFRKEGLKPWEISGDADGMGNVMISALREAGYNINNFHNSHNAYDSHYKNKASEAWFEAAVKIDKCEIILPADEELMAQLISRKRARYDSRGRLAIESKDEMRAANRPGGPLPSPDRADAVIGCMMPRKDDRSFNLLDQPTEQEDMLAGWKGGRAENDSELVVAGLGFGGEYGMSDRSFGA